jgi:hypothetical protein
MACYDAIGEVRFYFVGFGIVPRHMSALLQTMIDGDDDMIYFL